jgi:copper chaperone
METLKFKTNINCGGCIAKITPFLDDALLANQWEIDTTNPQKILTVKANDITASDVIKIVADAGFKAEKI